MKELSRIGPFSTWPAARTECAPYLDAADLNVRGILDLHLNCIAGAA
jgi:hypothetical protein